MSQVYADECIDDPTGVYSEFGGCDIVINTYGMACDDAFGGYTVSDICIASCESCGGGPSGCDLPDLSVSILDDGSVLYNSSEVIGAFQFKVASHRLCIDDSLICNGNSDCVDGSDESHCNGDNCGDESYFFDCVGDGSECIPHDQTCNGWNDCNTANGWNEEDNCINTTDHYNGCSDDEFDCDEEEMTVNGASGGVALEVGFSIISESTTSNVIAYSPMLSVISPGCGLLLEVDISGTPTELTNILFANGAGAEVPGFTFYDLSSFFGCMDNAACNYNEDAIYSDDTCEYEFDCTGECGGLAVADECGVCGGDGSSCSQNYDYELSDLNPSSPTYGINISPVYFQGQITLHYFGHQN